MSNLMDRITINPDQCGGRPCIRGMRIRVIDLLDLFAAGLTAEQILEEDGRSGLLQIQISENVPKGAWRTSFPAIADAIDAF